MYTSEGLTQVCIPLKLISFNTTLFRGELLGIILLSRTINAQSLYT
jgi:hypothetical protein